ncbi:MAG: NAD(P)-dependent glycerol-3-phosphate dehydrogenase [Lachnospiraceae bacterium]|nr:NAD(P)-dependent glycerol-3-phosphate dehydrogenase [Lachnospiraceae bacterium]
MTVTVLGAGTWGVALSILLATKGTDVCLWSSSETTEIQELAKNRNEIKNLPGAKLPESVRLTNDLEEAITKNDPELIVFAVASPFVRRVSRDASPYIKAGMKTVNVAKGIEESTLKTLLEVIDDEIPQADNSVLSGPSHAEEVSRLIPTTVVVASKSRETATFIQDAFMTDRFRVYTSSDMIGVCLGGSIKNVIALAAGISDGLGFGDNTKAALMTRGIAEISRLGTKMGCKLETLCGLSGIGDLFVTATSHHSRNWNAGYLIGKGMSADDAMKEVKQVVEGVFCAKAALKLAEKYDVEMPIIEQVNQILFEHKPALKAVSDLLMRDRTKEHDNLEW